MTPFQFDRAMSLHHRAYEYAVAASPKDGYEEFCRLCSHLAHRDDDPELLLESTTSQIWKTANAAIDAGMSKEEAFPLTAQLEAKGAL